MQVQCEVMQRILPLPDKNYFNNFNNKGHKVPQILQKRL